MSLLSKLFPRRQSTGQAYEVPADEEWTRLLGLATSAIQAADFQRAIQLYDEFIVRNPGHAEAPYKRAIAYGTLGRFELALADYDRAIALNPQHGYAFCNRGSVLERMDRKEDAVRSYEAAVAINPDDSLAYFNRGTVLRQLGRTKEALASFDQAIHLNSGYAEAYVNRGNVLQEMWRHEDAISSFEKAIAIKPIFAEAFQGLGTSFHQLKQLKPAIENFSRALALNPRQKFVAGVLRYIQMQLCDWTNFEPDVQSLSLNVSEGNCVCSPFALLMLTDNPSLHRMASDIWTRSECPPNDSLGPIEGGRRNKKIKVGYFSADFRDHPVAQLTAELFEQHDREQFEFVAFSFSPGAARDAMRTRLERAFDCFMDVQDQSDVDIASLARRMQIDVAVDLSGHTEHSRTRIFAMRAAPIQINFLGYPGTMSAEYIDYVIADRVVVPESQQMDFSEKIIYLPDAYLPSDSIRAAEVSSFSRKQLGLSGSSFVFCCFNQVVKLTPVIFGIWMRILKQVDGSVLWLGHGNPVAVQNLRREAELREIAPERIVFADRVQSTAQHRARLKHADLFLDTAPYNAHATALDAIWAGLPILTLVGEAFAGRVAASLLTVIGLPELIATTPKQYEEIAVTLAGSPRRMAEVRAKLLDNHEMTEAFDVRRFAANLETAYSRAFDRYLRGDLPDHIHLES